MNRYNRLQEKMLHAEITDNHKLAVLKLHFCASDIPDFLIQYWGRQLLLTEELIDCSHIQI